MSARRPRKKRRSFYQPESDILNAWLDAQHDLGRSLQLVIIDALRKYGEGDVITAFLEQREQTLADDVVVTTSRTEKAPQTTTQKTDAPVKRTVIKEVPKETPTKPSTQQTAPVMTQRDEDGVLDRLTRDAHATQRAQKSVTPVVDEEYDPIAIMMNDIGSKMT